MACINLGKLQTHYKRTKAYYITIEFSLRHTFEIQTITWREILQLE